MKGVCKLAIGVGLCFFIADSECMMVGRSWLSEEFHRPTLMRVTPEQQVKAFLDANPVTDIKTLAAAISETYHRRFFIKGQGVSYKQYRDYLAGYLLSIYNKEQVKNEDLDKCAFVLKKILKQDVSDTLNYQAADFAGIGIDSTTLSSVDIW